MSDLSALSLAQAREGLRKREFSAVELVEAHLAAMEKARALNAYVLETPPQARAMAQAADERLERTDARPLEGIALGVKDMFATKDVRTTAGSRILGEFVPTYESSVTANLWRDGAVLLGKLNNDEFAGGSIRQPAAFTGTVGVKPTYGRCSRWGIVAFASSLDQAGPLARSVRDAALLLTSMAGHDPKDTTCVDRPVPDYEAAVGRSVRGKKIGLPQEYRVQGMAAEIERLWDEGRAWLEAAGADVGEISLPHTPYALSP